MIVVMDFFINKRTGKAIYQQYTTDISHKDKILTNYFVGDSMSLYSRITQ